MSNTSMTKDQWVSLFQEIGLDDATMTKWHQVFESRHPKEHQQFLEWLNISVDEISQIRAL